jgi:hypothetical protein
MRKDDKVSVTVLDMKGRMIARKFTAAQPGIVTPVGISVGKGVYFAKVEMRGILAVKEKIIVP